MKHFRRAAAVFAASLMKKRRRFLAFVCAAAMLFAAMPAAAATDSLTPYVLDNGGFPMTVRALLIRFALTQDQTGEIRQGDARTDEWAATGQVLEVRDSAGNLTSATPIVVLGDVLGIGKAELAQLIRIAQAVNGTEPLEGLWLQAADFDRSGRVDLTDLLLASQQLQAVIAEDSVELQAANIPTYYVSPLVEDDNVPLYFLSDEREIPYIAMHDVEANLEGILQIMGAPGADIVSETEGNIVTLTRENGSIAELDFGSDNILFTDYNAFTQKPFATTSLDVTSIGGDDAEGSVRYISRPPGSFERKGRPIAIDLGAHGISMIWKDGEGYIPLQTFSDIFLSGMNMFAIYNGQMAAYVAGSSIDSFADLYYAVEPGPRSEELAAFSYNELCLALEMYYGLKEQHNIESFDMLFRQTGLADKLLSTSAQEADEALYELCLGYLADLHSGVNSPSPYAGRDAEISSDNISASVQNSLAAMQRYRDARSARYPNGVPNYEEVGDTAYVTLDSFRLPPGETDYYKTPPTAESSDTVGIVMYAHEQIMREGSPVKNVVLDLTNNGGGQADAAVFVIGWFLGGTAIVDINDTLTEAQASTKYAVDVNRDGVCDDKDTVASKNLYCLTSPNSFSCGNLVPAAFKDSGTVTLVGQSTGGGACVVRPLSTADGTVLQISGPHRISKLANGSYYDIDRGITPDIPITRIDNFYDRKALGEYLNGLFR